MARTKGARNADYQDSRLQLARKVREGLVADGGMRASLRELAASAGTSVATLKHYFADRDGLVEAVMESVRIDGAPHMARVSNPATTDVRESLRTLLLSLAAAWDRFQVGRMHGVMLAEGLVERKLGPTYVTFLLEPLLQMGEQILQRHIDAGRLAPCEVRQAALLLLAPPVLALLHQRNLDGVSCRPLELTSYFEAHVEAFLRAYPVATKPRAKRPPEV